MKKTNKKTVNLKVVLTILIVILLVMISFFGIYIKKNGTYANIIKDYNLAMELEGARQVVLKPDESTEKVTKDSEGNVVENATDDEIKEKGYSTEDTPVNSEEVLNKENFDESKNIIAKRLEDYKFDEYQIKEDTDNGTIILELAENDDTDTVLSVINQQGKFEIKDSESKEVLMDNSMIKESKVLYNNTTSGTSVYLDIVFNKEGKQKLEQISKDYATNKEETSSENTENSTEDTSKTQKEISMEIDGQTMLTTSFDQPVTNGELQLTVGSSSKDSDSLKKNIQQAKSTATVLSSGKMPVKYTADTNKYIKENISDKEIKIVAIATAIAIALVSILLIIKYKLKGFLTAILSIGFIAVSLLIIRYTNVYISIAGLIGIIAIAIINYLLQFSILKNENKSEEEKVSIWKIYAKFLFTILPIFIISLVFSFATSVLLNSFGMIVFWGILITFLYNIIFTNNILKN